MSTKRIAKPTGWVVDMRHYLDKATGDLPEAIPERVLSLAVFFGAVVAWVTDHFPEDDWLTSASWPPLARESRFFVLAGTIKGTAAGNSPSGSNHAVVWLAQKSRTCAIGCPLPPNRT